MKIFKIINERLQIFSVIIALLSVCGCASITQLANNHSTCFSTKWPHERSDLQPDPSLVFGKLKNGFRYVLKHNQVPQDRVALYLNVQAGSIHEKKNERGYAHYLEHMLFNGSTNFPPGELISYFQSIGMSFGADTNAYTTYDETVYKIQLPQGNIESIKKGLIVMSDYAQGALLLESEVENERGVIIAEKIARDSVRFRTSVAKNRIAFDGTLLAERLPIGVENTIKNANSSALRSFYNNWYRPENMILVAVGDFEIDKVESEIISTFAPMAGRDERPQCPDIGELIHDNTQTFYYYEPNTGSVKVAIESYWNKSGEDDSIVLQLRNLKEYLATSILKKRLDQIANTKEWFSAPRAYAGNMLDSVGYSGLAAITTAENWQDSLTVLENTLRQMLNFSITDDELEIAKKEVLSYFDSEALTSSSRRSTRIAQQIIGSLNSNRVYQSPAQEKELAEILMENISGYDMHQVLLRLWDRQHKLIQLSGNIELNGQDPGKEIELVYANAAQQSIKPYVKGQEKIFPYLTAPAQPAKPLNKVSHKKIDSETFTYANGAVLNLKKTDFKKNEVDIIIRFGPGKRTEPSEGVGMMAESIVNSSGSGKLTSAEMADALAGTSIDYDFNITSSAFVLRGNSLTRDFSLLMQTLYTLYLDPGIREDVFRSKKKRYQQMYESLQSDVWGAEALYVDDFLSGGNKLYSMASWQEVAGIEFNQLYNWVKAGFDKAIPEISVVGDFNRDEVIDLVNRYFGSLKTIRQKHKSQNLTFFPVGKSLDLTITSELDKALVVYGWKTTDFSNIKTVRRLQFLASVVEERLRLVVREKLGASYSPSVYNHSSQIIPGFGIMYVKIITETKYIESVRSAVDQVVGELTNKGVGENEVRRVKDPLLTSLKDRIQTNRYWLNSVLSGSSSQPARLTWPTTLIMDNASITTDEINQIAKKYLDTENAAVVIIKAERKK